MNLLLVLCALLFASSCSADKGVQAGVRAAAGSQSATVQPWLIGLTAVVVFLFIVFTILIVHRLLRKNRDDKERSGYDKSIEMDGYDIKHTYM